MIYTENKHPLGNIKIKFLKTLSKIFSYFSILILKLFFKIDHNKNELIISSAFYAPWKEDEKFFNFSKKIQEDTLLDNKRLFTLYHFSNLLKNINGDILDIGCLKGGAGFMMSYTNKKGKTFLIDTFEGLIENENLHKKNHFIFKDIGFLKNKIKSLRINNTKVLKGRFPYDFKNKFKKKIKLCHIDVNTYKSTKDTFNYVKKRIIKSGIVVFDDYGIYSVNGVKKFVDEIMSKNKDFTFVNNYMGQCILIKK